MRKFLLLLLLPVMAFAAPPAQYVPRAIKELDDARGVSLSLKFVPIYDVSGKFTPRFVLQSDVTNLVTDLAAKEPALGNPSVNGYVLSSTTAGVRSWIIPGTGPQGEQGPPGAAGPSVWGGITGTLSTQTDLQSALDAKANGSGTNTGDNAVNSLYSGLVSNATHTGDVTGATALTLATAQPAVHTWALAQTFTVAPVFTDQSGTRTALGLGSLATQSGTFSGTSSGTNTGDQSLSGYALLASPTFTGTVTLPSGQALIAPALGTPASGVATNLTGTASGLTAGNVTNNANLTGHVTSTGNAAVLGSFSSANLATALTDETGTGAAVFANTPTLVTPVLGAATGTSLVLSGTMAATTYNATSNAYKTGGVNFLLQSGSDRYIEAFDSNTAYHIRNSGGTDLVTISKAGATTFPAVGIASVPTLNITGVPFAGTGTTSFPLVYINDANATASTTLNTAGTYLGVNGDGTQDLMNLLKDGVSQFLVSSAGVVTTNQLTVSADIDNNIALKSGSGSSGVALTVAKGGRIGGSGGFSGKIQLSKFDASLPCGLDIGKAAFLGGNDNELDLGTASFRWKNIYAATSIVNSGTLAVTGTSTLTGDVTASSGNLTGGAGNMTITSGTGNSRTMALRTTTSGGTATTALTLGADQIGTWAVGVNAPRLTNLTTNGFVKTGSSNGTLSVDTATYYSTGGVIGTALFDTHSAAIDGLVKNGVIDTVTYSGSGVYDLTFLSAQADANYLVIPSASGSGPRFAEAVYNSKTTAGFTISVWDVDGAASDCRQVQVAVMRLSQ